MIKDGILNIYKPADWTSHDVVKLLRGITGQKRIGHTGTLDPMATGVLPVCFGTATRIMEYLDLDFKKYRCSLRLGIETDTLDIWGETINSSSFSHVTEEGVCSTFESFKGNISQIPPKYSAIKVAGRKLYDYARSGEEVEIKPRNVYIDELEIEEINLDVGEITFTVTCSKGTYIRSICRDVGVALGTGAAMCDLKRLESGVFSIEDAVELETLRDAATEDIEKLLYLTDYPLVHFGQGIVDSHGAKWFVNGGWLELRRVDIQKRPEFEFEEKKGIEDKISIKDVYRRMYNIYDDINRTFLGTAYYDEEKNMLVPDKIFQR